jgi:hypothetical protein
MYFLLCYDGRKESENRMEYNRHTQYLLDVTKRLLAVDSPTGFTNAVSKAAYVVLCKEGVGVVEVKTVTF